MDFTVEQLQLMELALLEREIKNKERLNNDNFVKEVLLNEIELSEVTRFKIYYLITEINFKKTYEGEKKNEYPRRY